MIRRVIYIVLFLGFATSLQAQQPFSRDIWLNDANTPVKVNCIEMDSTGYIWLGTDDGLYRYNGRSFTQIPTNTPQAVTSLTIYNDLVLAGFDKGAFGIWDGDVFTLSQLAGEAPAEIITDIYTAGAGVYWLATSGDGLYMVSNNYCTRYTTEDGLSDNYIYTILSPSPKTLLVATDQGINQIRVVKDGLDINNFTTADGLPDNIVRCIVPMKKWGWSWIGTHQGGLGFYCSKTYEVWTPGLDEKWQWGQVNDILPIEGTSAWVCTEQGYLVYVSLDDTGGYITEPYYYPRQKLYSLLMDATGNVWCGTDAGLKQLPAEYVAPVPLQKPYSLSELTAIDSDEENNLWYALKNKLYTVPLGDKKHKPLLKHTAATTITKILCTGDNIWIGTFGDGLWYSGNGRPFKKVQHIAPLKNESVLDVAAIDDRLWVAGLNGVEELSVNNGGDLKLEMLHNKSSGIGSDYVYTIYPDSKGRIWMATDGAGVCMYENGTYKHWDSAQGMIGKVSYSIAEDNKGNIWTSSFDKGLLVYNGTDWENIDQESGLHNIKITTLATSDKGQVIAVNSGGIDEYDMQTGLFRYFGRRSGIGVDSVSGTLNLSAVDTNGNVYIPYEDGLVSFGTHQYERDLTPKVNILSLNTFFREIHHDRNEFAHNENHVTFRFDGINYANPEQLFYRYKLEGYNEEWISTNDESVTFPQLPSGSYKFVVQVSSNKDFTSYGTATHIFVINKPFWMELWFLILLVVLVWLISYAYIRLRERNLKKLSQLQKERMIFEYENLKSQVNPHFLFNSLNTLTSMIEDDTEAAMQYTRQLSDLYRNMLSHKDKDLITLGEEWDIVENYIFVQKSRFGNALHIETEIPEKTKKTTRVVPMALQLLLENAMKHNIVSQAKPLRIHFKVEGDWLVITNNYQPKMSKEKGAGLGLVNIRKRYGLHTSKVVKWRETENEFIVEIPLI